MSKKQNRVEQTFVEKHSLELVDSSDAWSLMDPQGVLEKLFHMFKQHNEFIARKCETKSMRELREIVAQDPDAVDAVYLDYDSNTAMRQVKYTKGGLIKFKEYYTALLDDEGISYDKVAPKS